MLTMYEYIRVCIYFIIIILLCYFEVRYFIIKQFTLHSNQYNLLSINSNVIYGNIYIYIYIYIVIVIWWSPFIPSRNLDEVFTYNHIWL